MSTRANIIIRDELNPKGIQLYRHGDGYPDTEHGVLATISQAFEYSWELPRMEADDFAASIIRAWKDKDDRGNITIDGSADFPESLHGDIAYYYIIEPDEDIGEWKVEAFKSGGKKVWSGHISDQHDPAEEVNEK